MSKYEYPMTHTDGVVTVEIVDCKPEDSGEYRCVATNKHGSDETSCVVIVEGLYSLVGYYSYFSPASITVVFIPTYCICLPLTDSTDKVSFVNAKKLTSMTLIYTAGQKSLSTLKKSHTLPCITKGEAAVIGN